MKKKLVMGIGETGFSCARYFTDKNIPFFMWDSRENPSMLDKFRYSYPDIDLIIGDMSDDVIAICDQIVVSPGVALTNKIILKARDFGIDIVGDVELFCREVVTPIVAITGTNGKTTVTTMLGMIADQSGVNVAVGGNIGVPALDLLLLGNVDLYVLELSSFQLELTRSLEASVAVLLNISQDHLDRYYSMDDYEMSKKRIFNNCDTAIYNLDDKLTYPTDKCKSIGFTKNEPKKGEYGIVNKEWFAVGSKKLISINDFNLQGRCEYENALAVLAASYCCGFEIDDICMVLKDFSGLPHRCQYVSNHEGVSWFNDSKATNPGAVIASLEKVGEKHEGGIVLIAGGDGKGVDFSVMVYAINKYVKELIVFGVDGSKIATCMDISMPVHSVDSLEEAVDLARKVTSFGEAVVLSPGCASFDMFSDYRERGEKFIDLVGVSEGIKC